VSAIASGAVAGAVVQRNQVAVQPGCGECL